MQRRQIRSTKRTFDEAFSHDHNQLELPEIDFKPNMVKSRFQDFCNDIFLDMFQYLRPVDLFYSFTGLYHRLDALIEPYTRTLDFRLISKPIFQSLCQSFLPHLVNHVRVLHLSNTNTFSQINEILSKLDWSHINQLESLTLESLQTDELCRYVSVIHPLLEHLWRLTITFDDATELAKQLLINYILTTKPDACRSLTHFSIVGITFDLSQSTGCRCNENLRELTITLETIDDLLILYRLIPRIERLTCTILASRSVKVTDKVFALNGLSCLTLTLNQPIELRSLRHILCPHQWLTHLSLRAILCDERARNRNEEIAGLELEKLFRTFVHLTQLQFYFRYIQNDDTWRQPIKPNHLYLLSFTSHFWLDRSIQVATHTLIESKQRYIYTIPFAFDSFDLIGNISQFFADAYGYSYANVRHLSLSLSAVLIEFIYSTLVVKHFPNIRTITLSDKSTKPIPTDFLDKYLCIRQKSPSTFPCTYIVNRRQRTHLYVRTLDNAIRHRQITTNNNKRIRQLTIYDMTEPQLSKLSYYFPSVQVLVLYVDTLALFSSSNDWLSYILIKMTSLFSLTVHYPKETETNSLRTLLVTTLLAMKKHFFIKCNDGILNIWF